MIFSPALASCPFEPGTEVGSTRGPAWSRAGALPDQRFVIPAMIVAFRISESCHVPCGHGLSGWQHALPPSPNCKSAPARRRAQYAGCFRQARFPIHVARHTAVHFASRARRIQVPLTGCGPRTKVLVRACSRGKCFRRHRRYECQLRCGSTAAAAQERAHCC